MTTEAWQPLVHAELHAVARRLLRAERRDHTLQPTALVHEAWLRLAGRRDAGGLSHERFVALAATAMRRVLVDSARRRRAARRGGGRCAQRVDDLPDPRMRDAELVALGEALEELALADAQLAHLVELRVFGRHDVDETAALLGLSPRTVKRRWRFARSWLACRMRRHEP